MVGHYSASHNLGTVCKNHYICRFGSFCFGLCFFPGEGVHSFQQMIKVSGPKQRLEQLFEQWRKRHLSTQRQGGLLPHT